VLPPAVDTVETKLGESHAKDLRKIPLAGNTVGTRLSDILEDLCDQLINLETHVFDYMWMRQLM
jgi:hypothetical protein